MRPRRLRNGLFVLALLNPGCRGEPAPQAAPPISISISESGPKAARAAVASTAVASTAVASTAVAAPGPEGVVSAPNGVDDAEPPLVAADGTPLPQTEERPSSDGERFKRRMQRLAQAILQGDPGAARSSFFPEIAYVQVKDVAKPERDYRYRLMAHFERDIREYHKALGRAAEQAEFLGVVVPEARVEWMRPGREGNRLGYFRVLRSRLKFRLPTGAERSFELTSMISWRGEWYVVHLHGFE